MTLRIVTLFPDLLGTYGDGGNGLVLLRRAEWRGIDVELVEAPSDRPIPTGGDLYCLGGGEDGPQVRAADALRRGVLAKAVDAGAVVFGVCAGYQILGREFPGAHGGTCRGIELLDVETRKGSGRRAVGEVLADTGWEDLGVLTGFENHAGMTSLGRDVLPLGSVTVGVGNGGDPGRGPRSEGAVAGRVIGSYLHGPVLARNPALADALLRTALATSSIGFPAATSPPLAALDDAAELTLRSERISAAGHERRRRG